MKQSLRGRLAAIFATALLGATLAVVAPFATLAAADPGCPAWAPWDNVSECIMPAGTVAVSGTVAVPATLHLLNGAHLDASASGVTLNISGDLKMDAGSVIEAEDDNVATPNTGANDLTINVSANADLAAGSKISARNTIQGGSGGDISITVAGDMTLHGTPGADNCRTGGTGDPLVYATPSLGAMISAKGSGSSGNSPAGNVTIHVGNYGVPPSGEFTMERCSLVDASSIAASAGDIEIIAGKSGNLDGLVLSESTLSGTGAVQAPGGGPITIKAGCELTVSDTGYISSKGQDPGADLVLLKGCDVTIYGVVQSTTTAGHALPNSPANHCNADPVAHPLGLATGFTACVRIIGRNVTIDASGAHNGNVNVDGVRAPMKGWIDIFATKTLAILGDPAPAAKWAVSAVPEGSTNTYGGVITIKNTGADGGGAITTSGQAVLQASVPPTQVGGQDGGIVTIEAKADVALDGSFIEANAESSGSNTIGGTIKIRSYNGAITSGGDTTGHITALLGATPGTITLTEAALVDSYLGTVNPAATENRGLSGGAPALPADAQALVDSNTPIWDACTEQQRHIKSGYKFNDLNVNNAWDPGEPGLNNWLITVWDATQTNVIAQDTTHNDGSGNPGYYQFSLLDGVTYVVCETQQAGWGQTAPNVGFVVCTNEGTLGYQVTLNGADETGNNFGNRAIVTCKEDPNRAALLTRTVNTGKPVGGGGVAGNPYNYLTVQAAYDAAKVSGQSEVIGMFSKTTENVVLDGSKSLTITQCESAQVTAANGALPVWKLTSSAKLLIIGPDSVGGTIGWELVSGGHTLKSIRSNGASVAGVRVSSNSNDVSFNNIASSGIGLDILGSSNKFKSGTIGPNTGGGVHIGSSKTGNTVSGATIQDNGAYGVWVEGSTNTIQSNKLYRNAVGIKVTGASNRILSNGVETSTGDGIYVAGARNTIQDNKVSKNGGNGINVAAGLSNTLKSNASNNSGENTGFEFTRAVAIINGGSNKADGTSIPGASKCSAFFTGAAATCE